MHRYPGLVKVSRLCLDLDSDPLFRWRAASAGYRWAADEARRRGATAIQTYTLEHDEHARSLRYARWQLWGTARDGNSWAGTRRNRRGKAPTGPKALWGRALVRGAPTPRGLFQLALPLAGHPSSPGLPGDRAPL